MSYVLFEDIKDFAFRTHATAEVVDRKIQMITFYSNEEVTLSIKVNALNYLL